MWISGSRPTEPGHPPSRHTDRVALVAGLLITAAILSGSWHNARAAEPTPNASTDVAAKERIELFLALLKRRAHEALEAHRPPPPPLITYAASLSQGYESNVNLDGNKRGDFFTQEEASLTLRPRLTSWLRGELTYEALHSHYAELRDANLWMNTLGTTVQLQPHTRFQVDLGYEYTIANFPFDTSNGFFDHSTSVKVSFAQTRWLTQQTGWTYLTREYDTRNARDGDGTNLLGMVREDRRHTVSHDLRFRFANTSLRVGGQAYWNASNDAFLDFYDWQDYQLRGVVSHVLSPSWIGLMVGSYERRNYEARRVPVINIAERDTLLTWAGSLIYQLNDHTQLTYGLTYRHQDSNDPRLDFIDWINRFQVSLEF